MLIGPERDLNVALFSIVIAVVVSYFPAYRPPKEGNLSVASSSSCMTGIQFSLGPALVYGS